MPDTADATQLRAFVRRYIVPSLRFRRQCIKALEENLNRRSDYIRHRDETPIASRRRYYDIKLGENTREREVITKNLRDADEQLTAYRAYFRSLAT